MRTTIFILTGVLLCLTTLMVVWFWFMVSRPEKWGVFVDRENEFWVRRGIVSAAFADKCKRLEKGPAQKVVVGAGALIGVVGLVIIAVLLFKTRFLTHQL